MLRPFRESDFDAVCEYASDFETTAYRRWGPNRPEDTRAFLAEVGAAGWRRASSTSPPRGPPAVGSAAGSGCSNARPAATS